MICGKRPSKCFLPAPLVSFGFIKVQHLWETNVVIIYSQGLFSKLLRTRRIIRNYIDCCGCCHGYRQLIKSCTCILSPNFQCFLEPIIILYLSLLTLLFWLAQTAQLQYVAWHTLTLLAIMQCSQQTLILIFPNMQVGRQWRRYCCHANSHIIEGGLPHNV